MDVVEDDGDGWGGERRLVWGWAVRESWIRGYPDSRTVYNVQTIEA